MPKRIGSHDHTGQAHPTEAPVPALQTLDGVPAALADVQLVSAPTCAAAAEISLSHWNDLVREGAAPQPVMRTIRCTRWRLADLRVWLIERAERGTLDDAVIRRATKASMQAKVKRDAAAAQAGA